MNRFQIKKIGSSPLHLLTALIYLYCTASSVGGQLDSWLHPLNLKQIERILQKIESNRYLQHYPTKFHRIYVLVFSSTASSRINCLIRSTTDRPSFRGIYFTLYLLEKREKEGNTAPVFPLTN